MVPTCTKYVSLFVLCLQNSLLAIVMRISRVGEFTQYNSSTAVLMGEIFKVLLSATLIVISNLKKSKAPKATKLAGHFSAVLDRAEMAQVCVPALLYVVQNNLQYVAVTNLDVAVFQVLYQFKILTTAIFSVAILNKSLSSVQWYAILVLVCGVIMVQWDEAEASASAKSSESQSQSIAVGSIAVALACLCSGFAGVYFEKILKNLDSRRSIWEKNLQLGIVCILISSIGLFFNDYEHLAKYSFFHGYRPIVWCAISISAFGGLLTAVVVKYADNIVKAFATSIAIVLSILLSMLLFDRRLSFQFFIGATLVIIAVCVYGNADLVQSRLPCLPQNTAIAEDKKDAA